jgi:hypothetical protein
MFHWQTQNPQIMPVIPGIVAMYREGHVDIDVNFVGTAQDAAGFIANH